MTDTQQAFDYRAFVQSSAGLSSWQHRQYDREVARVASAFEQRDNAIAASIMEQALNLVPPASREAWRPRINEVLVNAGLPEVPEPQPEPEPEVASFQGDEAQDGLTARLASLETTVNRLVELAENRLGESISR